MSSLFDYDDLQEVAFQAKTAGKSLIAAKYDVIKATGDFLFNAHTDGEFAQRCEMIDDNLNKIAYTKLASLSDSKMKLVKALHTEWSLRHAKCKFAKSTCEMCADGELDSDSPLCKACRGKQASRRIAVSDAEADAWENHPIDCDCKLCANKNDTWGKDIEPSRNKDYNKGGGSQKDKQAAKEYGDSGKKPDDDEGSHYYDGDNDDDDSKKDYNKGGSSQKDRLASRKEAAFDPSWLHQVGHDAAQLAHFFIDPWTHKPKMGPGGIPDTNIKDTLIAGGELAAGAAYLYNKKKNKNISDGDPGKGERPFDWERDASRTANKYIEHRGNSWVILQKGTGKVLSHHASKEKAEASFRAMMQSKHEGSYKTSWGIPDQCDGCDQETLNPAQDGWHSEDGLYCPDCADRGYCGCDDCQTSSDGPVCNLCGDQMNEPDARISLQNNGGKFISCDNCDEAPQESELHDKLHEDWHRKHGDEPCTSVEDCKRKSRNYRDS